MMLYIIAGMVLFLMLLSRYVKEADEKTLTVVLGLVMSFAYMGLTWWAGTIFVSANTYDMIAWIVLVLSTAYGLWETFRLKRF